MKIVEIAFTGYPVTDMRRARTFYEDVLKLESTRTFENGDRALDRIRSRAVDICN